MEKPDSSTFPLTNCGKQLNFNIGDYKSKSQPKLKRISKLKKILFFKNFLNNKRKTKNLDTICEKKSYIPLQMTKSAHMLGKVKTSIQNAFLKAILKSGLRPVGTNTTAQAGKDPSYDSLLFINVRPTPDSTPNEITPTPTISEKSLPPLAMASPILHPEEPVEETTEDEAPDVQIRVVRPDNADDDTLSSTSSSSSGDRNALVNIQLRNHLKDLQDKQYLIDTKFLFGESDDVGDEEELELHPSPETTEIIPPAPVYSLTTPISTPTDFSSGDKADQDDDYDEKSDVERSNINIELIIMNKSSNETLCGDGDEERLPCVNNIAAPCLYQLGLRKFRSKMAMVGPVLQPFNETYLPTIFSDDFLNVEEEGEEEEEESECGTTVCVIAEIRVDDTVCECCRGKTHFCGLYYDCNSDEETMIPKEKYEKSEVSSYYESDGLSTDASAVEKEQKKKTSFRLSCSPERKESDLGGKYEKESSGYSPRSSRFTTETFYYSEISSKFDSNLQSTPRSSHLASTESREIEGSSDYVEKRSTSKSDLQMIPKSSKFTIQTFYYSEITSEESSFGSKNQPESLRESLEYEESSDLSRKCAESSGSSAKSSNFTMNTFYYSEITPQGLNSDSKDLQKSETTARSSKKTSNLTDFSMNNVESSGSSHKSSNFTMNTFNYSEITPQGSNSDSKDLQKSETTERSSEKTSNLTDFSINNVESSENHQESLESLGENEKSSDLNIKNVESSGYSPKSSNSTIKTFNYSEITRKTSSNDLQNSDTMARSLRFATETLNFSIESCRNSQKVWESSTELPQSSETSNFDEESSESSDDLERSSDFDNQVHFLPEISQKTTNFDVYCGNSVKNNIDFDSTVPESTEEETMSEKSVNLKQKELRDFCGLYTTFQFCEEYDEESSDQEEEEILIVKLENSEKNLIQLNISKCEIVPSYKYQDTCGLYTNFKLNNIKQQDLNSGATRKRNSSSLRMRKSSNSKFKVCEKVRTNYGFFTDDYNYCFKNNNNNDIISEDETDEI